MLLILFVVGGVIAFAFLMCILAANGPDEGE